MLNSHFQTLAKTNCPLTDVELRDVRVLWERLTAARARQLELIELPFPMAFRQMCVAEEERIAGDLSTCRALLNPARRLPVGVIARILAFYPLASDSTERHLEVYSLCQISSRWRNAALSVPLLWTTLRLILPDATNPTYADARLYMIDWFARAGPSAPLALHLDVRTPIHDDSVLRVEGLYVLVKLVCPYIDRLRYLSLGQVFRPNVLLSFLVQSQFKNLGSLVLGAPGDAPLPEALDVSYNPLSPEVLLPNLRRVKVEQELLLPFSSSSYSIALKDFPMPFNRLTYLTLESVDVKDWIKAMQDCTLLQFGMFHLKGTFSACDEMLDGGKSLLSYLTDLTLTFEGCVNPTVFNLVETSVLSTLRIGSSMPDHLDLWGPRANGMFAQMSKLGLLSLVRAWPIHIEVFHQLLENSPHVIELELELNTDVAPVFDALHNRTPVLQCHVPRLKTILIDMVIYALSATTIADFPLDGFLDFLESRAGTLKRCCLHVDDDEAHHVVREQIRKVLKKSTSGVSVSLTSQREMKDRGWRRRLPNHTSANETATYREAALKHGFANRRTALPDPTVLGERYSHRVFQPGMSWELLYKIRIMVRNSWNGHAPNFNQRVYVEKVHCIKVEEMAHDDLSSQEGGLFVTDIDKRISFIDMQAYVPAYTHIEYATYLVDENAGGMAIAPEIVGKQILGLRWVADDTDVSLVYAVNFLPSET
ncbi:unnamed protein product [Cyclocybe aegerita]|uniref:F-box domain-containing protein n=1 Tax=Cyclocybe aegerita TaxID=1973307 RepID=A0A8S0WG39_CYCAE|nr:unnamed protein product [Cyclocybe aegerita]